MTQVGNGHKGHKGQNKSLASQVEMYLSNGDGFGLVDYIPTAEPAVALEVAPPPPPPPLAHWDVDALEAAHYASSQQGAPPPPPPPLWEWEQQGGTGSGVHYRSESQEERMNVKKRHARKESIARVESRRSSQQRRTRASRASRSPLTGRKEFGEVFGHNIHLCKRCHGQRQAPGVFSIYPRI